MQHLLKQPVKKKEELGAEVDQLFIWQMNSETNNSETNNQPFNLHGDTLVLYNAECVIAYVMQCI